jgi:acyl dehydratase
MKVVDMLKHKSESLAKHHFEIGDLMSPVLREYWNGIVDKANANPIVHWVRDHTSHAVPAEVSTDTAQSSQQKQHELSAAAELVFQELNQQLDQEIHLGDWIDISQDRINAFGEVTEDMQWIHTDPERAAQESPFKTTIAHGFLTLALLSKMTDSVEADKSMFPTARMVVNVGLNQVRFPYPVKAGNRIRTRSKLTKVTVINKGLEVEREMKVEIDGVRRPGCVVTSVIRVYF